MDLDLRTEDLHLDLDLDSDLADDGLVTSLPAGCYRQIRRIRMVGACADVDLCVVGVRMSYVATLVNNIEQVRQQDAYPPHGRCS